MRFLTEEQKERRVEDAEEERDAALKIKDIFGFKTEQEWDAAIKESSAQYHAAQREKRAAEAKALERRRKYARTRAANRAKARIAS
jgi:hypothetical protein